MTYAAVWKAVLLCLMSLATSAQKQPVTVRLRGPNNSTDGFVEILVNGTWGTICGDQFDIREARVICGMLGFPKALAAVAKGMFGQGKGQIWLSDICCHGDEKWILQCPHGTIGGVQECGHSEDVGVVCQEEVHSFPRVRLTESNSSAVSVKNPTDGRVEIFLNGVWGTICDDRFDIKDAHVICSMLGFPRALAVVAWSRFGEGIGRIWLDELRCHGNETTFFDCRHGGVGMHDCAHYEDVGVICQEKIPDSSKRVRLVGPNDLTGSSNLTAGLVQVFLNGAWGTICDDDFDLNDARVICGMLEFPGAFAVISNGGFGKGSGQIWLDELRCHGNESQFFDCPHGGIGIHDCGHNEDVGVICREPNTIPSERVKLVGPDNSLGSINRTEGRVEILLGGVRGTICDDLFDINDAHVICRLLGFPRALAAVTQGRFGQGAGQIWLDNVRCYGNETSLLRCRHGGIGSHNCGHSEDAGVICQQRQPDPRWRRVRLVGSNLTTSSNSEGRVEILFNGVWGTICDDLFDIKDAHVVCRLLEFPGALAAVTQGIFGQGTGQIWLDNLRCYGNESSILKCPHGGIGVHNCGHIEDVGVICQNVKPQSSFRVRLVSYNNATDNVTDGRVEILLNGEWGTICDDLFDINDAHVICKQLGFPGALSAVIRGGFGQGTGRIWLDNLRCHGNETSIFQCPHGGIGVHNCRHTEDVGVVCRDKNPKSPLRVRLTGPDNSTSSNNLTEGFVELFMNGVWGTVCDDYFDIKDAHVLCRQLGFLGAMASFTRGGFGQKTGRIWLDNLHCSGNETSILQCPHNGIGAHNCIHSEDVGVVCLQPQAPPSNRVRLAGSKKSKEGRVEVFMNGLWGSVCNAAFRTKDARVVCRMLGFPDAKYAVLWPLSNQSSESQPIWIDNLQCTGNETSIFKCGNVVYGKHNCERGPNEDIGVICQPKTPSSGPTNVTVSDITTNSALVLWDRPLDDSADITQYRVYVDGPGPNITVSVGESRSYLQLNNLQPSSVYRSIVEVVNSLGGTAKSLAKEFKTKSVPSTQPTAPEIIRLSIERLKTNASDDILLVCKATGSLPMNFTWFKEGSVIHRETTPVASLNQLKIAPNGDGAYKCQAENGGGKDSRELVVTNENIRVLKQTQNQTAPTKGGYGPTLLGFFILLLIINFVLIAGIVFLLRRNKMLNQSIPHVELTDMKPSPDKEEPIGFENMLYSTGDKAGIVDNMETE